MSYYSEKKADDILIEIVERELAEFSGGAAYLFAPITLYSRTDGGYVITLCRTGLSGDSKINPYRNGEPVVGIKSGAFKNNFFLKSVELPDSLTSIEGEAFMNCVALKSIEIPPRVTEVRGDTFHDCKTLTTVKLHDNITALHAACFMGCESLREIKLPRKITEILANIELLRNIPNRKKVSATIFKEHIGRLDELKNDILFLHKNTCLDMNDLNFMIGFGGQDGLLTPLSEEEQVQFYEEMHRAFDGTELDRGVNGAWFAEFTPNYCTGCTNCGEKFFLLERNGDVYSCVRGQGNKDFYYGNIYENSVSGIMDNARTKIFLAHNRSGFSDECAQCGYIGLCKTGCTFVKRLYGTEKSYTCLLQKRIYEHFPTIYPKVEDTRAEVYGYTLINHPQLSERFYKREFTVALAMPTLEELIASDTRLKYIYSEDAFVLYADGTEFKLCSQLYLKHKNNAYYHIQAQNLPFQNIELYYCREE